MQFSCCIIDKLNDTVTRLTSIVASGRRNVDGVNLEVVQLVAYQLDLKWWRGLCSRSRLGDSDWQLSSVTYDQACLWPSDHRARVSGRQSSYAAMQRRSVTARSRAVQAKRSGGAPAYLGEGHVGWVRGSRKKYTIRYDTVYLTCSKKADV